VKPIDQRVAVLLPARDGDPFLADALSSLKNQTYQNWFCYLIADGDRSHATRVATAQLPCDQFRVHVYPIKERGLASGLNFGLQNIDEDLVARLDSDDVCLPNRLASQVHVLTSNANFQMTCSSTEWINSESQDLKSKALPLSESSIGEQLGWFNPITHSSVMYRRELVLSLGGYNPLARGCEDYDLWLRMLNKRPGSIFFSQEPLVKYRKHQYQLTRKSMVGRQLRVISASRREYLGTGRSLASTISTAVKDGAWSTWQRVRFP
jgi:glycosyltransferase involved in cell wall biosynthesis